MKIISKYKDYYDYLIGIYGVDEKAILDRTSFTPADDHYEDGNIVTLFVCDRLVQGYYRDGKWNYGSELLKFKTEESDRHKRWYYRWGSKHIYGSNNEDCISLPTLHYGAAREYEDVLIHPFLMDVKRSPNSILKVPILMEGGHWKNATLKIKDKSYRPFPILRDFNFQSVYSPKDMYIMLNEWLLTDRGDPASLQTNKEKILSHGFDLKDSFRNTK